jgi:hypothetical protein
MMMSNAQKYGPIAHRPLRFLVRALAILIAILGVAGCASISPVPFTALTTSIQQLRGGADASLSAVHERTRDRYIAEAVDGDIAKVEALLLTQPPDGDAFSWASTNPPLFLKVARFREGVHRLNSVLVGYAGLLGQLASPDLVSSEKFEQLAKDLNGNLKNAVQALGVSAPSNKEIAVFSTLATAAFRAYLQNKQRSSLIEALNSNQPAIQDAAELGAYAVRITAAALRNEHNHSSTKLATLVAKPKLSDSERKATLRELIELDEKFIKELSVLRTLHQSYLALPAAHLELGKGLADPKLGLPMVLELLENGRELYRLYEELSKDDKKRGATGVTSLVDDSKESPSVEG